MISPRLLRFVLAVSCAALGLAAQACASDDKAVPTASCSSSAAKLTIGDCVTLGRASGCNASRDDGAGGCQFEGCDSPPSCAPPAGSSSGAKVDAGRDPRCDGAEPNGLFSSNPPCDDPASAKINGVTSYYCKCTAACPCGYTCGSIALAVGGVIGNACAPAK